MSRRRRRALIVAAVLVLALLMILRGAWQHLPRSSPAVGLPAPSLRLAPPPPRGAINDELEAWAQAIADHGQQVDGRSIDPSTDPAVQALAEEAAAILAAQPWSDWRRLAAPGAEPGGDAAAPAESGVTRQVQPVTADPEAARREPGSLRLRREAATSLQLAPTGPHPFVLHAPEQALVLRVAPGPSAGLRLDGGLVVPGRFYLLRPRSELQTAIPVGIEIRPAAAVDRFHPEPIAPPPGTG